MSVIYTFRERLRVRNPQQDEQHEENPGSTYNITDVLNTMRYQIALLCSQLLCSKNGEVLDGLKIKIEADGKFTEYTSDKSDNILPIDIQEAIQSITDAKEIEIYMDYTYIWRAWRDYLSIGPFVMTGLLDQCDDKIFDLIDYTMFNSADCGEGAGVIMVYGNRDGVLHRGELVYSVVKDIPSYGNWYEPHIMSVIDNDDVFIPEGNIIRGNELCKDLISMCNSKADDFTIRENVLSLVLNQPELVSIEKTTKFVSHISELAQLVAVPKGQSPDDVFYMSEFFDQTSNVFNLMRVEISYSGNVIISVVNA